MGVTYQWRVQVGGGQQAIVRPGQQLQIGRKPLRPLPDEGVTRFEVADATKSMSKRHALFGVDAQGRATLRDLHSTNGSYLVSADGALTRLPADEDIILPAADVHMQFGDVAVDFAPMNADDDLDEVKNLFASAPHTRQEPDVADMSVDEILDLRAGEPTTAFRAPSGVQVADSSASPADSMPIQPMQAQQPEVPRDLFADAKAGLVSEDSQESAGTVEASQLAETAESSPRMDASADSTPLASEEHPRLMAPQSASDVADEAFMARHTPEVHAHVHAFTEQDTPLEQSRKGDSPLERSEQAISDEQTAAPDEASAVEQTNRQEDTAGHADEAGQTTGEDAAFTPVFEPGSVFDKVSRGQFDQPDEPMVEVDGMTSHEARTTTDMSRQFEMARHGELLPFLAMNPFLYDDLYAWLAAQGNRDIDEALANNEGYQSYREAVGK